MKRRWKLAIALGGLGAVMLSPIFYIETSCGGPPAGWTAGTAYTSVQPDAAGKRPEARSWLTYPEWYIVYSADSYGRYLAQGNKPSGFSYGREITGFWTGLCVVNKAAGSKDAGDAKITVAGAEAKGSDLKAGQVCDISYLGDGDSARIVACR